MDISTPTVEDVHAIMWEPVFNCRKNSELSRRLTNGLHHPIKSGLSRSRDGRDRLAIGGLCAPFNTMVKLM